ncbi:helix-turn-helix transcriptional regulator [Methylobacterium nigriterrae]|uniref:helix-turn-helix transcriptional regulator n=1 Tax=Methylobacterium nigriterrae TaxID=3127512 RepID=UPI003013D9EC
MAGTERLLTRGSKKKLSTSNNIPRLLRLTEVLSLVPVSRSTWWAGVRSKRFPQPIKLGPKITAWKSDEILAVIQEGAK